MSTANRVVASLLASPVHRLLSRSTALIRYSGAKTGAVHTTPVQYAAYGSAIVIAVAHPATKSWWRNFTAEHPVDLLIAGSWVAMTGLLVDPADHPDEAAPLIEAYLARFPRSAPVVSTGDGDRTLFVWCRPR